MIRARRRRWRAELQRAAPACARTMADALGAGRSIRAAIADAAAGADGAGAATSCAPRRGRSRSASRPRRCWCACAARAGSHAWDTLIAAVLLQRDAGGDLAALLRELAVSGEAAERAERDARAATAQARFTAWLVLGLPAAAALPRRARRARLPGVAAREPALGLARGLGVLLQLVALACVRRLARSAP